MIRGMANELRQFEWRDIVQTHWKQLSKLIRSTNREVYWLSPVPEKNANTAKISLLVDKSGSLNGGYEIISGMYSHGMETVSTAFIPEIAAESLAFFLLPASYRANIKRDKAGRPAKYNSFTIRCMMDMRNRGKTFKEIAEHFETSTSQIQRLLNKVQTKEQRKEKAEYVREKRRRDKQTKNMDRFLNQMTQQIITAEIVDQ